MVITLALSWDLQQLTLKKYVKYFNRAVAGYNWRLETQDYRLDPSTRTKGFFLFLHLLHHSPLSLL